MSQLKLKDQEQTSSSITVSRAVFNLMNSTMSAGTLALPFAFASCGWLLGILLVILVSALSSYTMNILVKCVNLAESLGKRVNSYEDLGYAAFGKKGLLIIEISLIFDCFGCLVSYLDVIADQTSIISLWTSPDFFLVSNNGAYFLCIIALFFLLPLCLFKDINILSYSSLLGISCLIFTIIAIIIRYFQHIWGNYENTLSSSTMSINFSFSIFLGFPLITFAYCGHFNTFHLYQSLPVSHRHLFQKRVIPMSFGVISFFYLCVSLCGYFMFGEDVTGDILKSYNPHDLLLQIARISIAIAIMSCFPLLHYACRNAFLCVLRDYGVLTNNPIFVKWFPFNQDLLIGQNDTISNGYIDTECTNKKSNLHLIPHHLIISSIHPLPYTFITLTIVSLSVLTAILVPKIVVVFSLVGAILVTLVAFILPVLFYLKLKLHDTVNKSNGNYLTTPLLNYTTDIDNVGKNNNHYISYSVMLIGGIMGFLSFIVVAVKISVGDTGNN